MARRTTGKSRVETFDTSETETVPCPICQGQRRNCRYCEGYGDVHPDDVPAILTAHAGEQRNKKIFIAMGGVLFAGLLAAVFMIVRENVARNAAEEGGEGTETVGTEGGGGEGGTKPKAPAPLPPGYSKEVKATIIEMRLDLKVKMYGEAIKKGEAALTQTQDPVQRKNIEDMIKKAKEKLAGK